MASTLAALNGHLAAGPHHLHGKIAAADAGKPAPTMPTVVASPAVAAAPGAIGLNPAAVLQASRAAQSAGLAPKRVYRNLSVPELYEMALRHEPDTRLAATGALCVVSGEKTGALSGRVLGLVRIWRGGPRGYVVAVSRAASSNGLGAFACARGEASG